ncbi:MAG: aldo/keto reductase [Sphaerochaeta sp.]|nr:aldo/keto reductase [Sphaerochaeta sp.]
MIYKQLGTSEAKISAISMGGHEYLPDRRSRGFNEDFKKAITPGYIFEGFGQENRLNLLKVAFDHGINFFDVTHDSEKDALGRNLQTLKPPYPIYVQTRPEGFVYTYDENNAKMANYDLLKAEVIRILKLLRRERIEFFNLAFMKSALEHDPQYLLKISDNIARLKREGLIQFACADTFSGEYTYLKQIETGAFDAVYINFNFGDHCGAKQVLPQAKTAGLGVIAREAFMKGALFEMAKEAGIEEFGTLANAALKWVLSFDSVTTVVYGTGNPKHLTNALNILESPEMTSDEQALIDRIRDTEKFKNYELGKTGEFCN